MNTGGLVNTNIAADSGQRRDGCKEGIAGIDLTGCKTCKILYQKYIDNSKTLESDVLDAVVLNDVMAI